MLLAGIGIAAVNAAPQDNAIGPAANDNVGLVVVKAAPQATVIPEVIVFEYPDMDGQHKHYLRPLGEQGK